MRLAVGSRVETGLKQLPVWPFQLGSLSDRTAFETHG